MSTRTIVPTYRRVDGEEPSSDLNQWMASIPDTFTAEQAATAAGSALLDAKKRIGVVRDQYTGTLPPPPWPTTPELSKAIDQMTGGRDFFVEIGKQRPTETWTKTSKAWTALSRAGSELYQRLDDLDHASANAPALRDMLRMVPDPRDLIFGFSKTKVAVAAVAAYLLIPQVKRFVRRTVGLRLGRAR